MKIIGLDLSLTSTGAAVVNHSDLFGTSAATDAITSRPTSTALADRSIRLRSIVTKITEWTTDADLVVVEGPSFGQQRQGGQHDRAGLWWLTVARLTGQGHTVIEVPPACVKKYATGKGNAKKDEVLAAVVRRYPDAKVAGNDEADALVLAAMGARAAGHPLEDKLGQQHLDAMRTIAWPELVGVAV